MYNNFSYTIIAFAYVLNFNCCFSQKSVRSDGYAELLQTSDMGENGARTQVVELAKINAVEKAFGTYVERIATTEMHDGESSYNVIGNTRVTGEWMETLSEPKITSEIRGATASGSREIWWKCSITGRVREYTRASISFECRSLNGPDKKYQTESYKVYDRFFLYFKSAVDGYLNVFIKEPDRVNRLLPYKNMTGEYLNYVPIKADQEYLFFSPENNILPDLSGTDVDKIRMWTSQQTEHDILYVIFSTVPFNKPILEKAGEHETGLIIPKSLSKEQFEEWFTNNRLTNPEFQYQQILLEIKK